MSWMGISSADPDSLQDHIVQFVDSSGGFRTRRSFIADYLVILCVGFVE